MQHTLIQRIYLPPWQKPKAKSWARRRNGLRTILCPLHVLNIADIRERGKKVFKKGGKKGKKRGKKDIKTLWKSHCGCIFISSPFLMPISHSNTYWAYSNRLSFGDCGGHFILGMPVGDIHWTLKAAFCRCCLNVQCLVGWLQWTQLHV